MSREADTRDICHSNGYRSLADTDLVTTVCRGNILRRLFAFGGQL